MEKERNTRKRKRFSFQQKLEILQELDLGIKDLICRRKMPVALRYY
jgi:hypothetical protein